MTHPMKSDPSQTLSFGGGNQQPSQEEGGSSESSDEVRVSSPIHNNPPSGGVYYNNLSQGMHPNMQQQMFNPPHPHHLWASPTHR